LNIKEQKFLSFTGILLTKIKSFRRRGRFWLDPFQSLGKIIFGIGLMMIIVGGTMMFAGKLFSFGKLPGDIYIQKGNFTFFFPIVSMIIISIILTILLNVFFRK